MAQESLGPSAGFTPPGYPGRMPRWGERLDTRPIAASNTSFDPSPAAITHITRPHVARLRSASTEPLRRPGEEVSHLPRFPAPHGAPAPRGALKGGKWWARWCTSGRRVWSRSWCRGPAAGVPTRAPACTGGGAGTGAAHCIRNCGRLPGRRSCGRSRTAPRGAGQPGAQQYTVRAAIRCRNRGLSV